MKRVLVRYKIKPDRAVNEELVNADQLLCTQQAGTRRGRGRYE
jgi:hypothetical protein